jgi:CBS domain-containing protein
MAKVSEHYRSMSAGVDLASPEASIDEVIANVSRDPASRSIFVVDAGQRLLGIISARQILAVLGGKYSKDFSFGQTRELLATRAIDLMEVPYWVSPTDDLEKGLRLAVQHDLQDIPVVQDGRVIGNLDCLEIIIGCNPTRSDSD